MVGFHAQPNFDLARSLPLGRTAASISPRALLSLLILTPAFNGCGGGTAPPQPSQQSNPVPTLAAISPNSSVQNAPPFTLSAVGTNLMSSSVLEWDGSALTTTVVSDQLLTAQISSSNVAAAGPYRITVSNPSPGGGRSNALNLEVPCVMPQAAPSATQTKARLGSYFFDGWSGPLTNFHFAGLPLGPFQDRQPVTGWQDNFACTIEQEIVLARNFGVNFFVFDWYFNAQANDPIENLNSGIEIMHGLADRHGMQYAILYVNAPPFIAGPTDWSATVNGWLAYMIDSAYLRINGKPALFVIDINQMVGTFGSDAAVQEALQQLQSAAQSQGLPGVYVIGGFWPSGAVGQYSMDPGFITSQNDGYDAICYYNYPGMPPAVSGENPFSALSEVGHWTWDEAAQYSPLPFIPVAMAGWDARPWNEGTIWYSRSPQDFAMFVGDAISWANANPSLRLEPTSVPPLVMIEAWNEIGEGSHFVPTAGEGTSYGDALAAMLLAAPADASKVEISSRH